MHHQENDPKDHTKDRKERHAHLQQLIQRHTGQHLLHLLHGGSFIHIRCHKLHHGLRHRGKHKQEAAQIHAAYTGTYVQADFCQPQSQHLTEAVEALQHILRLHRLLPPKAKGHKDKADFPEGQRQPLHILQRHLHRFQNPAGSHTGQTAGGAGDPMIQIIPQQCNYQGSTHTDSCVDQRQFSGVIRGAGQVATGHFF